jgi:hypothetical protein
MFIVNDLGEQIMREIDASSRQFLVKSLNLYPPGGVVGQLPQTAIFFDAVEAADATIPASGASLLTNLNRIRAGTSLGDHIILQRHLSSGLIVPTETRMTVQESDGSPILTDIHTLVFTDADLTLVDVGTAQVDIRTAWIEDLLNITSGYITRSWFINGAVVSGVRNPAGVFEILTPAVLAGITVIADIPGNENLGIRLISSTNGTTWSTLGTATHPSGQHYGHYSIMDEIPSGTLIGFEIIAAPELPVQPFENITVVMRTVEVGIGNNAGASLPTFTPRRIPFADNTTGLLTESSRLNHSRTNGGDMVVVGADDYTYVGGTLEKVGVCVIRDDVDGGFIQETYSNGTYSASYSGLRARGTHTSPEAVQNNDVLFRFTGRGYTSTGWSPAPNFRIESRATQDWIGAGCGTRCIIGITPNGQTTTTDMLQVDETGLTSLVNVVAGQDVIAARDLQGLEAIITGSDDTGYPETNATLKAVDPTGKLYWDKLFYSYANKTGTQTIANGFEEPICFDNIVSDQYACISNSCPYWTYTVPQDGTYRIDFSVLVYAGITGGETYNSGDKLEIYLCNNGNRVICLGIINIDPNKPISELRNASCTIPCQWLDQLEVRLTNSSSIARTISDDSLCTYFMATKVK